jgi:hypothetical protein
VPHPSNPPVVAGDGDRERAARWADRLGVALLDEADWRAGGGGGVVVWSDARGLALRGPAAARSAPVRPPPLTPPRPGRDPLLRAVPPGSVIDATAGLAFDAAVLIAAGREVTLIERHPALCAILADAIERWRAIPAPTLHAGDARILLRELRADVVIVDPMYPSPRGRARKGEALHLLRALVGGDDDQAGLLAVARRAARARVVVKRPLDAPPLAGLPPSGSLVGRTVRFDLYPPQEEPS